MSTSVTAVDLHPVSAAPPSTEAIFAAVVFGARDFLATPDWAGVLDTMLGRLGLATGADQVRVFRNQGGGATEPIRTSLTAEWLAPGIPHGVGREHLQELAYAEVGCARWEALLAGGERIVGLRAELPESERAFLASQGIVSLAAVPVFAGPRWWGFMTFADCTSPRTWSARELDALSAAASVLGAASARQEMESHIAEAQTELKRSEDRYRRLVEATVEGIVIHDGHRILDANPSLAQKIGLATVEEAIGRSPLEFIHPDSLAEVHRRLAIGDEQPYEALIVRADGSTFPAEIKGSNFFVDGERLRVTVVRDITERKQAQRMEKLLLEEEAAIARLEQMRRQAEFLADATRVLTSSFDTTTTLQQLAHLAVRFLADYCIVTLYDRSGADVIAVVHADRERQDLLTEVVARWTAHWEDAHPLSAAQRSGDPFVVAALAPEERDAMAHDDEHRAMLRALDTQSLMSVPIRSGGELMGSIMFASVSPDRRFTEEHLALAQELGRRAAEAVQSARSYQAARAATQARDDMLAVVAHDLRNPLNTIHMASTLALETLALPATHPGHRQLDIIQRSSKQMKRLIQDLLDATRLQSGQLALEREPTAPEAIVGEAAAVLQPLAEHAGLALETAVAPDLPTLHADRLRLQQVLSNLVGNAIKFTPRGGRITIAAQHADGAVQFAVTDTGPGIPSEQLPHLFAKFWQARRNDRRGLGLGLSIAKGIVEAHGGELGVVSEPGAGSTFQFTVPARPEGAPRT